MNVIKVDSDFFSVTNSAGFKMLFAAVCYNNILAPYSKMQDFYSQKHKIQSWLYTPFSIFSSPSSYHLQIPPSKEQITQRQLSNSTLHNVNKENADEEELKNIK